MKTKYIKPEIKQMEFVVEQGYAGSLFGKSPLEGFTGERYGLEGFSGEDGSGFGSGFGGGLKGTLHKNYGSGGDDDGGFENFFVD